MSQAWSHKSIVCEGKLISPGLGVSSQLLPHLDEIDYRMRLVMKSIEMIACEGRQLSYEDFDRMEHYETEICRNNLEEAALQDLVFNFERDFFHHLQGEEIEIDPRALT